MTKKQKDIIYKGVAVPVVVAVLLTILITISLCLDIPLPYISGETVFADFSNEEIVEITQFDGQVTDTISRADIGDIQKSSIIGTVQLADSTYPLIFNANDVNAIGKLNITNDRIIGEVGVTFMELYKNEGAKVKMLNSGEIIAVNTFYNEYEFEVVDTFVAKNNNQLKNAGEGMSSAIVLYTDNSMAMGIGNEKFVAVCKLISGTSVTE